MLTSGTWDAPPSLLITCERNETVGYLINCGEGIVRFCHEHHIRLTTHLQRIFLTRLTWEVAGGLPDVLLTHSAEQLREKGKMGTLRLHGLTRLAQLVQSFTDFVRRDSLPQEVSETPDDWADGSATTMAESGIEATPLLLCPEGVDNAVDDVLMLDAAGGAVGGGATSATAAADDTAGADAAGEEEAEDAAGEVLLLGEEAGDEDGDGDRSAPAAKRQRLEGGAATASDASAAAAAAASIGLGASLDLGLGAGPSAGKGGSLPPGPASHTTRVASLCWLLQMPPEPAKFDVAAAMAIGVPTGRIRERLCQGESVTLQARPRCNGCVTVS